MKTLGQINYEAYGHSRGWRSLGDEILPLWEGQEDKEAWEAGAQAVLLAALEREKTIRQVVRRDREGEELPE